MSVKAFFFCVLFVQTSASFFDEFRGAMWSVENSFGKLVSDVVTDVRDTIGCTILAVKQVLALGGIFHESSEYDARCRGINNPPTYIQEKHNNYPPTPPFIFTTPPNYVPSTTVHVETKKSLTEQVSDEIEDSIKNVNHTMFELISKNSAQEKMENVTTSLLNESDRLTRISNLLRHELNNISEDVKMELGKVEPEINNPTINDIWNSIRALHDVEINHSNTHEAVEVHHILDEVLSVLRGYDHGSSVNIEIINEKDTNNTFIEIKNQFIQLEQEESQDLDMVENIVETDLSDKSNNSNDVVNEFPLTFRDVAIKIMDETSRKLQLTEDSQNYETVTIPSTGELTTTAATHEDIEEDPMESPEYAAIFQLPKDKQSREQATKDAQKLIEKSKETEAIMNTYFQKSSEIGTSLFDNPDLFDFGKK